MIPLDDYDITEAFKAIEDELIASMIRNMKRHRAEETEEGIEWSMWQAEQLKALEKYKRENQKKYNKQFKDINKQIIALIQQARDEGNMQQEIAILNAIKNGFKSTKKVSRGATAEFFKLNERKLEALIEATTDDMEKAEVAILRKANDDYRKAIFNAQVYANTGAGTYEKAVDMATRDMLSRGLNCVVYANGARHTLADYADMAIRTASKRAYLQGEGEKRQEWGIATVIVNKRGNPCPKCLPFCGKVLIDDVWSGGSRKDGKYPLMSTAVAHGLYHPRCRDSHTTYFPGISTADDTWTEKELEAIGETNREEARQQYATRQAEKYDRLAEHSLDSGNRKQYQEKAAGWKAVAKSNDSDIIKAEHPAIKYKTFNSGEEVNDFFYFDDPEKKGILWKKKSSYSKWLHELSEDERECILDYTAGGYGDINDFLRKRNSWETINAERVQEMSAHLDSAISKFTLKNDIIVQRGVMDGALDDFIAKYGITENTDMVGKIFHDDGYMSTTVLSGNSVATAKPVMFEISVPAGQGQGAYVNELSGFTNVEYEFLLRRGADYTITEVVDDEFTEKTIIRMVMNSE